MKRQWWNDYELDPRGLRALWIVAFPLVWYVSTFAIYRVLWATGLFPINPSGLPTLLGVDLSWWLCGVFPILWIAIAALALKGRLPGTSSRCEGDGRARCAR